MEEHKSRGDLSSIEPCSGLLKPPRFLDVKHEVTTIHKLHDKEQTVLANRESDTGTFNKPIIIKEEIIV